MSEKSIRAIGEEGENAVYGVLCALFGANYVFRNVYIKSGGVRTIKNLQKTTIVCFHNN